jgi:large subunit ribosomal protein L25
MQWDTFGIDLLHVDFTRVSEHERVTVLIPLEMRGDAPGLREGGTVEAVAHEIEIECEAESIPEKIDVVVKELHLGGEIKAGDLSLPAGAKLVTDANVLLVHCVVPRDMAAEIAAETAEPEVIGRKPGEEEAADEES